MQQVYYMAIVKRIHISVILLTDNLRTFIIQYYFYIQYRYYAYSEKKADLSSVLVCFII